MEPGDFLVTMRLEGKVVGPWVEECHRTWDVIREDLGSKKLRLDVRGVMFMDKRGTALLRQIHGMSGAEVLANSPLTNYFAEQIVREIKQFENEGV